MKLLLVGLFSLGTVSSFAQEILCKGKKVFGNSCNIKIEITAPDIGNQEVSGEGSIECFNGNELVLEEKLVSFLAIGTVPEGYVLQARGELIQKRIPQVMANVYIEDSDKFQSAKGSYWNSRENSFNYIKLKCETFRHHE